MSSYKLFVRYVTALCLVAFVLAQGPAHPPLIDFPSPGRQLEDRVDQLEAKQAVSEQRQNAIAKSFSQEMTTLVKDSGAIKTTVNRLVEDSVQMMGRIRILQDVGQDVVNLRRTVDSIQKGASDKVTKVQNQVNAVAGKLNQLASANTYITVGLSTQMKQNKELLKSLQNTLAQLESKITTAEQKIESMEKSSGSSGNVAGIVETLKGKFDEYKAKTDAQIAELEEALESLRG